MNIIDKIDEVISKLSFEEYINDKRNKKKLEKIFNNTYNELATQVGEDFLEDDRYYDEEDEWYVDPIEAYENYSHTYGHGVEYDSAEETIKSIKRFYDYKKGDERDEEKQLDLIKVVGYDWRY